MTDDVQRSLGRIEGKLDGLLDRTKGIEHSMRDHGDRIEKVEQGHANTKGWAAAIAFAVSLVVAIVGLVLR